jgi:hypothetical protein
MSKITCVVKHTEDIIIPELEEIMKTFTPHRFWNDKEIKILKKYYKKVPKHELLKYLPGRTYKSIQKKFEDFS